MSNELYPTQEHAPKSELERDISQLLEDRGCTEECPQIDITLYQGAHATAEHFKKFEEYTTTHNADIIALEGITNRESVTNFESTTKAIPSDFFTEASYSKVLDSKPCINFDIDQNDPLSERYTMPQLEELFNKDQSKLLSKVESFDDFKKILVYRCIGLPSVLQNRRENTILEKFPELIADCLIKNKDLFRKNTLKIVIFFGAAHKNLYSKISSYHSQKSTHQVYSQLASLDPEGVNKFKSHIDEFFSYAGIQEDISINYKTPIPTCNYEPTEKEWRYIVLSLNSKFVAKLNSYISDDDLVSAGAFTDESLAQFDTDRRTSDDVLEKWYNYYKENETFT